MSEVQSHHLGLPVVQIGQKDRWLAAVSADPYFGSLYELSAKDRQIDGAVRYRYAASQVPIGAGQTESRHFGVWLAAAKKDEPFGRSVDAFFRQVVPRVPPGPRWRARSPWSASIFSATTGRAGKGTPTSWPAWWPPTNAITWPCVCTAGTRTSADTASTMPSRRSSPSGWPWAAHERSILRADEVRRWLKLARDRGFRVLLYFGDGLLQDSGANGYRPQWDLVRVREGKRGGWTGPDTWGDTFARNPAHPEVFQWDQDYLAALLRSFGAELDGFVWDETFYVRAGTITLQPRPAYCDRAMMQLVETLAAQVKAADPQKVFLASDCIHSEGLAPHQDRLVGYALVADGAYQDTGCSPTAWFYGLFPNWRNTLWSCNWESVSAHRPDAIRRRALRAPVAISNGWCDDCGPSKWTPGQREQFLRLFRQRLGLDRVQFLTDDPQRALPQASAKLR